MSHEHEAGGRRRVLRVEPGPNSPGRRSMSSGTDSTSLFRTKVTLGDAHYSYMDALSEVRNRDRGTDHAYTVSELPSLGTLYLVTVMGTSVGASPFTMASTTQVAETWSDVLCSGPVLPGDDFFSPPGHVYLGAARGLPHPQGLRCAASARRDLRDAVPGGGGRIRTPRT